MSSFTPGPWKAEIYNDTLIWVIHAPNQRRKGKDTLIARMYGRDVKQAANARLIAAAPELVDQLWAAWQELSFASQHPYQTTEKDAKYEAELAKEIYALLRRIEGEERKPE